MAIDNPISLMITSDTIIGANVAPEEIVLPVRDTYLVDAINFNDMTRVFTVPPGVRVLRVTGDVTTTTGGVNLTVYSNTGKKYWLSLEDSDDWESYVGVTPNKSYTVQITFAGPDNIDRSAQICYSQSINQQTPSITDY